MDRLNKCYIELANAIVQQAAEDYMMLLETGRDYYDASTYAPFMITIGELEKFFYSKHFAILTTVDPGYFIRLMKEKVKNGGRERKRYWTHKI